MDFTKINKIAAKEYLPKKALTELEADKAYTVTGLKQVTTKYGKKVVADLNSEFQVFLPARVCEMILKTKKMLENMSEAADDKNLILTYRGGSTIEFSSVNNDSE